MHVFVWWQTLKVAGAGPQIQSRGGGQREARQEGEEVHHPVEKKHEEDEEKEEDEEREEEKAPEPLPGRRKRKQVSP